MWIFPRFPIKKKKNLHFLRIFHGFPWFQPPFHYSSEISLSSPRFRGASLASAPCRKTRAARRKKPRSFLVLTCAGWKTGWKPSECSDKLTENGNITWLQGEKTIGISQKLMETAPDNGWLIDLLLAKYPTMINDWGAYFWTNPLLKAAGPFPPWDSLVKGVKEWGEH